jgi:hypothetical protein
VAHKKIIRCNNVNKLGGVGMYLCRVRCRWEKEISNHGERIEDDEGAIRLY